MSCQEELNECQTSGVEERHNPSTYVKHCCVPAEDLNNVQKNVRNLVVVHEHPILGRKVIAVVDCAGKVGTSVLVKNLCHCFPGGGVVFCGLDMINLDVLAAWVDAHGGRGPALVIMDLPRSTADGMDFETVELIKNV